MLFGRCFLLCFLLLGRGRRESARRSFPPSGSRGMATRREALKSWEGIHSSGRLGGKDGLVIELEQDRI